MNMENKRETFFDFRNRLNQVIMMLMFFVLVGIFLAYLTIPFVEAMPFTNDITGMRVHCKVIQNSPSCDVIDRKNGIYDVKVLNGEDFNVIYDGFCSPVFETPSYVLTSNQIDWWFWVRSCNGPDSPSDITTVFHMKLEGNKFDLIETYIVQG